MLKELITERITLSTVTRVHLLLVSIRDDVRGQGLTEYALIIALIAVVAVAALTLFGGKVTSVLDSAAHSI